ncbi:glycosyl hydrolase [Mucilaginibacter flavidus]|uniref:glycosyl hydrolase n=1 Tax=Mucilaginibacter flavidus TaxID=2949309 RepID=UPI002093FD6E|nr:glycosyl hydrolase [Mucilaginibacter flavidus]MCO5948247.1 glycoside hydrolase family protein [Mucilaginibacter flavidus]
MKNSIVLRMSSVSGILIICLMLSGFYLPMVNDPFILGVNGHPLNHKVYLSTPVATQASLLKSLGMSYYRVDIGTDLNGTITNESKFLELATVFQQNNLKILPMLYPHGYEQCNDALTAYNLGKKMAGGFATKYGKYFDHYEIANEIDLKLLKKRTLDGKDTSDYDSAKSKIICNFLKGMNDGVKESDPTAKTIINMCETHSGFIKLLKSYNINFDIIGQHWYSNKMYSQSVDYQNTVNDLLAVYNYKKPIWITEFNQFWGSINRREESQSAILNDFINNCSKNKMIQALFIYELLDEPDLKMSDKMQYEKKFGIVERDAISGQIKYKPFAKARMTKNN